MKFWWVFVLTILCIDTDLGSALPCCGHKGDDVSVDQQQQQATSGNKKQNAAANTIQPCIGPGCSRTNYCRTEKDKRRCEAAGKICYANGKCGDLVYEEWTTGAPFY